ncbi:hypothetical protein ACU4GD_41525 [Cupriavidus basilensis]
MPGKFKDYIAIPKINGYQSLHTRWWACSARRVGSQIRTRDMHQITAEAGVAAHWMYKHQAGPGPQRYPAAGPPVAAVAARYPEPDRRDSQEFLEHVKIDLFPDAVMCSRPRGSIAALPCAAPPLDCACARCTAISAGQCVAVKINNERLPLSRRALPSM